MAGRGKSRKSKEPKEPEPEIEFTEEEVELLIRVLKKHRSTVPNYLLSMQRELEIIASLLEKLS